MTYRNILVAYDGSALSDKALDTAIELSKRSGANLEIVHVHKLPNLVLGEAYIPASPDLFEAAYKEAERIAERARERLRSQSANGNVQIIEGQPAYTIVEFARNRQCDLIVIGSRGLSGLKELVLGSVSHNVVQQSHVPVLVVK